LFRTFKASRRFACAYLRAVRGATIEEFITIPSSCQIRPLTLFERPVVPISAVRLFRRNEEGMYHTPSGLSSSSPCLLVDGYRSGFVQVLGSEATGRPRRNEERMYHTPSRLSNPRYRVLTILRHLGLVRCSPVRGATRGDYTAISRSCQIRPGMLSDTTRLP